MIDMEKFPELKSLNRFIITFFFVLGVTFSMVAPFSVVHAESVTYLTVPANTRILVTKYGDISNNGYEYYYEFTEDTRWVYLTKVNYGTPCPYLAAVGDSNCQGSWIEYHNGTYSTMNTRNYNVSSDGYWIVNSLVEANYGWHRNDDIPWINENYTRDLAIYYTYGEGAIGESDLVTLGSIEDVKYSTQINSHGDDSVDTISWYPYFDSNNNPAVGWNAQIRVVPGYYYDSDRDSLIQQAFNLFHKEEDQARLIYDDHFVQGSFSITWGDVRNKISITSWQDLFGSFVSVLDGSYWYKRGWIYQIRIYDRDNDIYSEWQDVYTVTSSSGEGVENIIDPSDGGGLPDYYNNVENSFNTTSVVNNNYDVVYYYINTPVDTNPSSDDSNEYLKEIRNNVIQIRQLISIDNKANNTPNNDNNPWRGNPAAELYDFEDSSINDFNDAVGDLPTSDLITGNKFLAASTWVRTQYETIVSNTPFEAVIVFSLLLGFGLLLIGKLR